jgi:subtilisin family serine protease
MSPHIVHRRFEIHSDPAALASLRDSLRVLRASGDPRTEITEHQRTPMVSVRLTGSTSAVAKVRERFSSDGVTVLRDWLDVLPPSLAEEYPDLRALLRIDPEERSRSAHGHGEPVVVAIIDSGIDVTVTEFNGRLWTGGLAGQPPYGARFNDGRLQDYDVTDQDGHGTMLAGTILATANGARGIELMALKFFDVVTQPAAANAAAALRFAADRKPAVINLSFDLGIGSNELRDAFRGACRETDALIVIAAGNTGSDNYKYPLVPACYADECREKVIVVMATDWYDERPTFSNFGAENVDIAAPGVGIVSTRPRVSRAAMRYARYTGTSAAAAHVAGAAALLKAQNPKYTAADLKRLLMMSIDPLPRLKCASGGRLNLGRALQMKQPASPATLRASRVTRPAAGAGQGDRVDGGL